MLVNANSLRIPLADNSVHCAITSPPYWGLRDYGAAGQLGLEPTPQEYVDNMRCVFAEVWRVLRDDGTLWLNLGDTYSQDTKWGGTSGSKNYTSVAGGYQSCRNLRTNSGCKPKDLVGIPWRVAFALQDDGWYLRSDIIWSKPNPMPESVTDRPTKAHEYIFLLAKHERYYYDAAAIKEQSTGQTGQAANFARPSKECLSPNQCKVQHRLERTATIDNGFRNRRTVWTVSTEPYSGAHYAVFPTALVEPMILAGCPAGGIVLDPFAGSGTVGEVARRHRRRFVGLDISYLYLHDQALARAEGITTSAAIAALPLFGDAQVGA